MKLSELLKLRMSPEMKDALEKIAEAEGRSLADVVRRLLAEALENRHD